MYLNFSCSCFYFNVKTLFTKQTCPDFCCSYIHGLGLSTRAIKSRTMKAPYFWIRLESLPFFLNRKNRKTQNFKSLKKNDRQGVKELILRVLYKRKFLLKKLQGAAWGHTPPLHLMYNKYVENNGNFVLKKLYYHSSWCWYQSFRLCWRRW